MAVAGDVEEATPPDSTPLTLAEQSGDFTPVLGVVAEAVEVTPQISGMQARRHSRARPLRARCTGRSYTLQLLNAFNTPFAPDCLGMAPPSKPKGHSYTNIPGGASFLAGHSPKDQPPY